MEEFIKVGQTTLVCMLPKSKNISVDIKDTLDLRWAQNCFHTERAFGVVSFQLMGNFSSSNFCSGANNFHVWSLILSHFDTCRCDLSKRRL